MKEIKMAGSSSLEMLEGFSVEELGKMWDDADEHGDRSKEGYTKGDLYQAIVNKREDQISPAVNKVVQTIAAEHSQPVVGQQEVGRIRGTWHPIDGSYAMSGIGRNGFIRARSKR